MRLVDLIQREPAPQPWSEGDKIPWHEPGFSRRMLKEHLSQEHDAASRRTGIIEKQVNWIHHHLLRGQTAPILDLGCGPGLYLERLARLGHVCVGIDYSPASIAYARERAVSLGSECRYVEADIRQADYGSGYGLVMLVHGEFNTFRPSDARLILDRAGAALEPGGLLVLEAFRHASLRERGLGTASWYSSPAGLFSERPHLCLQENHWDEARHVATTRYYVVDGESGEVTRHAESLQAYTDGGYQELLADAGFSQTALHPSLSGPAATPGDYYAVVARK